MACDETYSGSSQSRHNVEITNSTKVSFIGVKKYEFNQKMRIVSGNSHCIVLNKFQGTLVSFVMIE